MLIELTGDYRRKKDLGVRNAQNEFCVVMSKRIREVHSRPLHMSSVAECLLWVGIVYWQYKLLV